MRLDEGGKRGERLPRAKAALSVFAAVIFAAVALSACGGGEDNGATSGGGGGESSGGGTITVGAGMPLTGPLAENGQRLKQAYEFAVDKVNAAGGINGEQVKLITEDDQADPATATTVVKKLISSEGAQFILGTFGTDPALAGSQVAEQYEIPNVQPFASAPELVERGFKFIFNTFPLASQTEKVMTDYLNNEVKPKTAAIVYINNPFAIAGSKVDVENLEAGGTEIVMEEEIETAQPDYSSVVSKIAQAKPEALLFILYPPDQLVFMKELKQFDVAPNLVYINGPGAFEPQILEALGDTGDWVVGTPEWYAGAPLPAAEKTMAEYEKEFNQPASMETFKGIQAAEILFHAIEEAGETDAEAVREALLETDFSPMGEHVAFQSDGQIEASPLIAQLQNLKGVTIWPPDKKQGTLKPFPAWNDR